jgi:anthranilate phosphoribosyltransferase
MLKEAIVQLKSQQDLSRAQMEDAMRQIMTGKVEEEQIIAFLTALRDKGETVDEITGAAQVMRDVSQRVTVEADFLVDTCGTGGAQKGTFNISTAAAFVVAGAGAKVAKHGNRSITSKSGSADVLEALGVKIDCTADKVKECIEEVGMGFFFAPNFHPAMRHVGPARKKIGTRTIFNILGPLTNPAGAKCQLLGVFDAALQPVMAEVLKNLGSDHVWVVHGSDGVDEITLTGSTEVVELKGGTIQSWTLKPEEHDLKLCTLQDLQGQEADYNARLLKGLLEGYVSPLRDAVVLNAAAALVVANLAMNLAEGIMKANHSLDEGHAFAVLKKLVGKTQGI